MVRPRRSREAVHPVVLYGIPGSPGLAIGRALVIDARRPGAVRRHIKKHQAESELARYDEAVTKAVQDLAEVTKLTAQKVASAEASILDAYRMMLEDATLREDVERRIEIDLLCAEWAVESAAHEISEQLRGAGNPYLAERSHDIVFVADLLQRAFAGRARPSALPDSNEPRIIVARDLSPADTAALAKDRVLGIVTEVGTRTSHTAILARALEIPAVVGVPGVASRIGDDDRLVVDGFRGHVTVSPTRKILSDASARAERHLALARDRQAFRGKPCTTRCGVPIAVRANIELPAEAHIARFEGADGIGLYRTEFLYIDRTTPPSEDEQYEVYKGVVEALAPLPVTLRTFDIGGDKFVSSFQAPQDMNPALGLRAVRLALSRPEMFLAQLRAMARASVHGSLRIMVPMVTSVDEIRRVRKLLEQATAEVRALGHAVAERVPLGIMVEVPAAAIMAREFARIVDFISIGTNDLVQYALAVDRTSQSLAELGSPFDPAVLRLIRMVIDGAKAEGRSVGVCGAMASNPIAATLLVGMGIRELSMEASAITEVKEALGRVSLEEAEALARATWELETAKEVEQALTSTLAQRFSDLLATE